MSSDSSHLYKLKDKLPHTWEALLARFGRFTEIQAQAIEPLLAGKNCVLVSATASGKTEAALAPLLERHKQNPQAGLSFLYIVPTRALTRDLARRLQQPLEHLAVRMQVKTGDEPALNPSRPPEMLLTTPESFDSLLANMPRMAKDVRAVTLDEIYLYDNTVRGDQLRILLNRLRRIKAYALSRGDINKNELQFCALSATVSDPASVAARYFIDPVVVQVAGQRQLDAEIIPLEGAESFQMLFANLHLRGSKKVLAFSAQSKGPISVKEKEEQGVDPALSERLRQWRSQKEKDLGVSAFVVMHNSVLEEIARQRPRTISELELIRGIGQRKIEQFGQEIIELVRSCSALSKPEADDSSIKVQQSEEAPGLASAIKPYAAAPAPPDVRLQIELFRQGGPEPDRGELLAVLEHAEALKSKEIVLVINALAALGDQPSSPLVAETSRLIQWRYCH